MTNRPTLPPDDDRDFEQFTGAFDRPVAPAPAFAERLKQQVANAGPTEGASPMQATTTAKPRVSRMSDSQIILVPSQRTSGGSILEILAAAVLIFALVSSGFYMYRIQNGTTPTDPDGQRLAATTPLASPTPAPDRTNGVWTDPGHTNAFPAGFDPATAQPAEQLADLPFSSVYGRVVDDSLVVYGIPQDETAIEERGESVLSVIDLESGDERWSTPLAISGAFTADENTIYAQVMDVSANPVKINLVAFSLETGERLWTRQMQEFDDSDNSGVDIVSPFSPISFGTPIAIDGNLYVARTNGDVLALDGSTGDIIWESASETDVAPEDAIGGSLVGNDRHLYVVDSENAIIKLDRKTGDIVDRFAINNLPSPEFFLYLHLQDNRLVLIAQDAPPQPGSRVYINVFDTGTGDTIWNTDIDRMTGNVVITGGVIGFASAPGVERATIEQSTEEPLEVRFLSLDTGNLEFEYFHDNAATVTLTAAGSAICIHDAGPSTPCVNADDPDRTLHPLNIGSPHTAEGPPSRILFWNDNAIVLGHEGGPHIIRSGATPAPPATTTPLASPMPVSDERDQTWTDPGHTYAFPAGFDPETVQPAEPLGDIDSRSNSGIIVGDTLILTGLPADVDLEDAPIDPTITAVDLTTGEQLWSEQRGLTGSPVAGQDAFYTVEVSGPVDDAVTVKLVSIAPETGETHWEHTLFDVPEDVLGSNFLSLLMPELVAIGDHVYIADGVGEITAFHAASGEIIWQQTEVEYFSEYRAAPFGSLVGNDDYLFVENYERTIVKHDVRTGEVIATFGFEHNSHQNDVVRLFLFGDRLVVLVWNPFTGTFVPESDGGPSTDVLLQVLDSESGESLWKTELGGLPTGSLVLTDDVVGIPQHYSDEATPATANNSFRFIVEFFDLETGELVDDYSPAPVQGASLSASGSVVCVHESAQAISCDDMADHQFDPTAIDLGAGLPAEGPPSPVLFWNGNAIVLGHEGGPHIIRSGAENSGATPETTPLATVEPVGTDPGTARGGGFGTTASLDPTYPDSALPTEPLGPTWKQEISAPKWMMPYGGVVAVLGTSELAVYDDQTGEELWSLPVEDVMRDQVARDSGNASMILALHAGPIALPWIEGETLYVTTPSELVGLDLMTGEETFRTPHHSGDIGLAGSGGKLPAGLTIADNMAYVQGWPDESGQASLSAIDLSSGEMLWSSDLAALPQNVMVVADELIILAVTNEDGDRIIALNAADGSVAWTVEDVLSDEDQGRLDGTTLFTTDGVIVQTRMTTKGQDEPSGDPVDALRVAAYDVDTGDVLWTSRSDDPSWGLDPDAINGCGFFPRVSGDALLIPCWTSDMASMSIVSLPIDGDGTAETSESLSELPGATTMGFVASDTTWIYGTDEEIVHLDLASGAMTSMGVMGGETCDQRAFPTSNGLACLTTDGLGTYYLQVFGPESGETGTPDGTPQASPVAPQASIPGPTAISTPRRRRLTRFHAGTNSGRGACGASCDRDPGYSGPRSAALQPEATRWFWHPRLW